MNTINFKRNQNGYTTDPLVVKIREYARMDGWATSDGLKEFVRTKYKGTLHNTLRSSGFYDWTRISFKNKEDYDQFCKEFMFVMLIR